MDDKTTNAALTRRQSLTALMAAGAVALPSGARAQTAATAQLLPGANVCVLTAQVEEGPFYFDPKLERIDITEGKTGVPLGLRLQVVNAGDCTPVKAARVDVWHADALGYYSGYSGQSDAGNVSTEGQKFLRGTQFSNDTGLVNFTTIYPGWYQGRTTHIHCKVILGDNTVLTAQLYFPDALSEYLYTNVAPYNTRSLKRDTVNASDMLVQSGDADYRSFCSIKEEPGRYLASLIVGVDRNAKPAAGPGIPPGGPPPGGSRPGGAGMPPRGQSRPAGPLVPGIVKAK